MSVDALMAEIGKLDVDDRCELAERIRQSVEADFALTPAQEADLERRIAERETNPRPGISHEDLLKSVRGPR